MGPFLSGFADELIKVAGPWGADTLPPPVPRPGGGIVRPPSTGTRGAPAPKPPNAFGPTPAFSAAIPTQKLESPAGAKPQQWRPSPGYKPSKAGDPTAAPPTPGKRKGGGGGPGTSDVPWETAPARMKRIMSERAYNRNLAGTNDPKNTAIVGGKFVDGKHVGGTTVSTKPSDAGITSRKSYKLTPTEMTERKDTEKKQQAAEAERKRQEQIEYNKPHNKAKRWHDLNEANATSSLYGKDKGRSDKTPARYR